MEVGGGQVVERNIFNLVIKKFSQNKMYKSFLFQIQIVVYSFLCSTLPRRVIVLRDPINYSSEILWMKVRSYISCEILFIKITFLT